MKGYEYSIKIVEKGQNYKSLKFKRKRDYYIGEEMAILCSFGIPEYLNTEEENSRIVNFYNLKRKTFRGKNLGKLRKKHLENLEKKLVGRYIEFKRLPDI